MAKILPFKHPTPTITQAEIDHVTDTANEYAKHKDYEQAKALLDSALWAVAGRLPKHEIIAMLKQGIEDIEDHVK